MSRTNYKPGQLHKEIATRKEKFDALNRAVRAKGAWLVSVPGDIDVTMQCLPNSPMPDELKAKGYTDIEQIGETEMILHAIEEKLMRGADGQLVPHREGFPVAEIRRHAGICKVAVWRFTL